MFVFLRKSWGESYWKDGAQMFPTMWLADSAEHDRLIAEELFHESSSLGSGPCPRASKRMIHEQEQIHLEKRVSETDRYRIIAPLGKGGMGEVFRARDTLLQRDVALKVLPADLSNDPGRLRRLEMEARSAGQINHPNVVAVYDVATVNGVSCIISELLDGQTLGQTLSRGKLGVARVIRYAIQIAEGLAAAHRRGIVHRDLKPDNIFITIDDHAKILDFGLAKSVEPAGTDADTALRLTQPGAVLGTVGYMSPEQVRGGGVDQRSDIFSFGVVLFEMMSGRRPFERNSAGETFAAILNDEPQELSDETIPRDLLGVLRRCLAKNPEARYQSAQDLAFHLEQLSPGAVSTHDRARIGTRKTLLIAVATVCLLLTGAVFWYSTQKQRGTQVAPRTTSLAVLPFVNMSGDQNDEYFSDGMTEELINALAKVDGLRVAARTSSFAFKGKDTDVRPVAKKLGVEHLLEGSVRKTGNRLRVTAQLINGSNGFHVWSETYDREIADVFAVQEEIARKIVARLTSDATADTTRVASASAAELEAYDLYLKGRFAYNKAFSSASLELLKRAIDLYEKAVARNPRLAAAYSGLANAYTHLEVFGEKSVEESHRKAAVAARKALELDPTLAEAHVALGEILHHHNKDVAASEREFKRAIDLNPNLVEAHVYYANLLLNDNRVAEALAESRRALQLDPLDPQAALLVGTTLVYSRRYDEAIPVLRDGLALAPDDVALLGTLAAAHSMTGDHDKAIAEYKRWYEMSPSPFNRMVQAWAYARAGRRAEALKILNEVLHYPPEERDKACHSFGGTYIALGDHDRAIEWLDRGLKVGTVDWIALTMSPWFDALRSDPRFVALIQEAAAKENRRG